MEQYHKTTHNRKELDMNHNRFVITEKFVNENEKYRNPRIISLLELYLKQQLYHNSHGYKCVK